MPVWHGGAAVLEAAREHCLNRAMQDALDRLLAIQDLLMRYGLAGAVAFDLGETRGMEYYTGITFKGYAPGLGFSVCSGGRYDDLVGHFGPPQPAVGCALWLDRILLVRQRQGREPIIPGVDVLVALADDAGCLGVVQALRHQGRRVEVDVTSRDPAALKRHTQHRGTGRLVICHGNGRLSLWQEGRETEMDVAGLLEEASTW